jgi:hypothetical protein
MTIVFFGSSLVLCCRNGETESYAAPSRRFEAPGVGFCRINAREDNAAEDIAAEDIAAEDDAAARAATLAHHAREHHRTWEPRRRQDAARQGVTQRDAA